MGRVLSSLSVMSSVMPEASACQPLESCSWSAALASCAAVVMDASVNTSDMRAGTVQAWCSVIHLERHHVIHTHILTVNDEHLVRTDWQQPSEAMAHRPVTTADWVTQYAHTLLTQHCSSVCATL